MVSYKKAKRWVNKNIVAPYTSKRNGRGYKNRMNLYKEVSAIKKMVNAEKQNAELSSTASVDVAQFNGAASGVQIFPILPIISQGISEDQRKGDSLKICSWCFKTNVQTNSFNTLQDVKYKIYILRQPINPSVSSSIPLEFLEPNTFSGVADYYSNRNYQHFKDYIVMGVINGKLGTNTNDSLNQYRSNTHTLARKQEFHVRYSKGSTTVLNNPIYALVVASEGDRATDNKIMLQHSMKVFFYDN